MSDTVFIDNSAPVIYSIATSTGLTTAVVTWETSELSSSTLRYGTTTDYLLSSSTDTMIASHTISIKNLVVGTTYHFRVESTDAYGNTATSSDLTFSILDNSAPTVSSFVIPATSISLVVPISSFTASDDYGVTGYIITNSSSTPALSDSAWEAVATTTYIFATAGSKTLYAYARDNAGNISSFMSDTVFVDNAAPIISAIATSSIATSSATITWTTDENATTLVQYGLTTAYGLSSSSATMVTSHTIHLHNLASSTTYHYRVISADSLGNTTTSTDRSLRTTDDTIPSVTSFLIPSISSSTAIAITSFTAADNEGVTAYIITESATAPTLIDPRWETAATTTYIFGTPGNKTLYAYARDNAGNISNFSSDTILVDISAPSVTLFTIPAISSSTTVVVTSFTASDNDSISGYLVSESSSTPSTHDNRWENTATTTITFATPGSKTLYAFVRDNAGNVSVSQNDSILIDTSAPSVTSFTIPATSTSLTVAITSFTATDNNAVTSYLVNQSASTPSLFDSAWEGTATTSFTFATPGSKTLYAWSRDAAGNISSSMSDTVLIDNAAPIISVIATSSVATSSATISWTTDENATTLVQYGLTTAYGLSSSSATMVTSHIVHLRNLASSTTYHYRVIATDNFGNTATSTDHSFTTDALYDTTNPVIAAFTIPSVSSSTTINISSFTATDNNAVTAYLINQSSSTPNLSDSAWETTPTSTYTFATSGAQTLYAWVRDSAGNLASSSDTILIDTQIPVITAFAIPASATSLTVAVTTLTATDNDLVTGYYLSESNTVPSLYASWSGAAPASYTFASEGAKVLYAFVRDSAGNISLSATSSVTITLPTPPPSGGGGGGGGGGATPVSIPINGNYSMLINNGAVSTASRNVSVSFNADGKLVTQVQLSESSDLSSSLRLTYQNPMSFTLSPALGTKKLYARFWMGNNYSAGEISDTIILLAPSATSTIPGGGSTGTTTATSTTPVATTSIPGGSYTYKTGEVDNWGREIVCSIENLSPELKAIRRQQAIDMRKKIEAMITKQAKESLTDKIKRLSLEKKLTGRILIQVQANGEAWYLNPDDKKRYFLARPTDMFNIMRKFGLGATHKYITETKVFPVRLSGKILIDVEDKGRAYYINPTDRQKYSLACPSHAFYVVRKLGLGITNADLDKIKAGLVDY
jgi:hypothetical protein